MVRCLSQFIWNLLPIFAVSAWSHLGNAQSLPVAWGKNQFGTLGDGTYVGRAVPVAVFTNSQLSGLRIVALTAGAMHSAAITEDGRAFMWGRSIVGTTSDGTFLDYAYPFVVDSSGLLAGRSLVQIAAGLDFTVAIDSTGQVFGWGINSAGQLGDGTIAPRRSAVAVDTSGILSGKQVIAIAAGAYHCLAITKDGRLAAWGDDSLSQLGDGGSFVQRLSPVWTSTNGIADGERFMAVSAGQYHSLALSASGKVYSWGWNLYGQLGTSNTFNQRTPVLVDGTGVLSNRTVTAISAGSIHSLALTSEGEVFSWGNNDYGQLGDGSNVERHSPVAVSRAGVLAGVKVVAIGAFGSHNLALTVAGSLVAWGDDTNGRLGDGSGQPSDVPTRVYSGGLLAGRSVTAIGSGSMAAHSLALTIPNPPFLSASATGQSLQINLQGLSNTVYRLDTSAKVGGAAAWKSVTNLVTGTSGSAVMSLPVSGSNRFWRSVAVP